MASAEQKVNWLTAAVAAGAAGYILYSFLQQNSKPGLKPFSLPQRRQQAERKQAFVLSVHLRFANEYQKQHFISVWRPLAEYVKAREPATLAFELLEADTDPCHLMVYERYLSRADYEGPHRQSAAFKQFKEAVAAFPFSFHIDGQSFIEQNVGFML
eukprot:GHUV01005025.1.p1 GENE.GHUV01005025.1~~GHUV01005025.1.p1  ORF type:complete len:157 (+),score=32.52 GHUV01005025.1:275-745(+)